MKRMNLLDVQHLYNFKQPLSLYMMGISGKPEAREQKAFVACLMAEFPEELGHDETLNIYSRLVVATSDFYDGGKFKGKKMQNYKKMGYQPGTPDLTILYPAQAFHGFVCEMKRENGDNPTPQQNVTLQQLQDKGYYAICAKGFAQALFHWLFYLGHAS